MKAIFAATLLLTFVSMGPLAYAELNVLGFQAWKMSRVEEAKAAFEQLQADGGVEKTTSAGVDKSSSSKSEKRPEQAKVMAIKATPAKSNRNDSKLQQAQLNVEVAQELTVNDYFVLYLNQFSDKEAFLEAAKKLSPDEMAELMMAYKKSVSGANQEIQAPTVLGGIGNLGNSRSTSQGL